MSYIPNTEADRAGMLKYIGAPGIDSLFSDIPVAAGNRCLQDLPEPLDEIALLKEMVDISRKNRPAGQTVSFLGAGAYDHFIPSVVRHIVSRSEFYTAYTPYQPEMSQGILQAMYEYQTMVCSLTGMDVSNASHYDGATAAAEAAFTACAHTGRKEILISQAVSPAIRQVLLTYSAGAGIKVAEAALSGLSTDSERLAQQITDSTAAVLVQSPNFFGAIEDIFDIEKAAHSKGALLIMHFDPVSLGILKTPGQHNADIAVAEGQPFGMGLNFGGPYLGMFAVKKELVRLLPGRVVGMTRDHDGKRGFVLTLQTREQHIRREKAASNICSNQALCALAACVHMAAMGKKGLYGAAAVCAERAAYAIQKISEIRGYEIIGSRPVFKEFVVRTRKSPKETGLRLSENGITGGFDLGCHYKELEGCMLLCVTEMRSVNDIDKLVNVLKDV